jgi:hypothetical protein
VKSVRNPVARGTAFAVAAFLVLGTAGWAQVEPATAASQEPGETAGAVRDLQDQVRQLRSLVEEMRAENAESRAAMHQLRQDLQATRALLERPATPAGGESETVAAEAVASSSAQSSAPSAPPLADRVQKLEESTSLIGSKIDEQYQTKVESASKYRARLHGIVLMNAFRNVGGSDDLDFPTYALWARRCASRKLDLKFSARTLPGREHQPTFSSIFLVDSLPPATALTSESSACKPRICDSIGNIPRW